MMGKRGFLGPESVQEAELSDEALAYFPIKDLRSLLESLELGEVSQRLEDSIPEAVASIAYFKRLFRGSGFKPCLKVEHYEASAGPAAALRLASREAIGMTHHNRDPRDVRRIEPVHDFDAVCDSGEICFLRCLVHRSGTVEIGGTRLQLTEDRSAHDDTCVWIGHLFTGVGVQD